MYYLSYYSEYLSCLLGYETCKASICETLVYHKNNYLSVYKESIVVHLDMDFIFHKTLDDLFDVMLLMYYSQDG
jgi:hypothetical protein